MPRKTPPRLDVVLNAIFGDSLLVMTSLAEKERLKGKVQTIYFDPPYEIKFGSNRQVSTRKRDVKDGKIEDATRQLEQIPLQPTVNNQVGRICEVCAGTHFCLPQPSSAPGGRYAATRSRWRSRSARKH